VDEHKIQIVVCTVVLWYLKETVKFQPERAPCYLEQGFHLVSRSSPEAYRCVDHRAKLHLDHDLHL
jgi:hypothetical protein